MLNINYKVERKNIYVGKVIQISDVYWYPNERYKQYISVSELRSSRSILFVPNDKGCSNDLLYNSLEYPILGIYDDNEALKLQQNSFMVNNACNMDNLLKFLGYSEQLGYEDLKNIRQRIFAVDYANDNCALFGYEEVPPEKIKYIENGRRVMNPGRLKELIEEQRKLQKKGYRVFRQVDDNALLSEYFYVLNELGDKSFKEARRRHLNMNAFRPSSFETKVKKLKK